VSGRINLDNKVLICKDCGNSFDFTVRDPQFYVAKGFTNEPQRCRDCRSARKAQHEGGGTAYGGSTSGAREMHDAICAQCNQATTVPFRPRGDRPVYCRNCFTSMNAMRA
jgi:CxxC-x17-CxxC domain-containing protein